MLDEEAELFWDRSQERFRLATPQTTGDVLVDRGRGVEGCVEVLRGRLFFAVAPSRPEPTEGRVYLTLNKKLHYVPFCADFG